MTRQAHVRMKYILLILALVVRVAAASITHTASVFPALTDWSVTNSIPKFDPSLGTLTNVTVTASASAVTALYFESNDTIPRTVTAGSVVTVAATAASLTASAVVTNTHTQSVSANDGVLDYGGSGGFTVQKSGSDFDSVSSALVSPFVGSGTIPVTASAVATGIYEGPGDYFFFVQTQASAIITVTYEFSLPPCPECPPAPVCDPKPSCDPEPDCKPRVKPPQKDDDDCDDYDDRRKRRNRRR